MYCCRREDHSFTTAGQAFTVSRQSLYCSCSFPAWCRLVRLFPCLKNEYTHTRARTHAHTKIYMKQGGKISEFTHTHTHARARTHTHTSTHAHTHTPARTHACTHARTHARTHTRTHTHTKTDMKQGGEIGCICCSLVTSYWGEGRERGTKTSPWTVYNVSPAKRTSPSGRESKQLDDEIDMSFGRSETEKKW